MAIEQFATLIIDSDLDARMRLKQATASVSCFSPVQLCSNFREAMSRLTESHAWDIAFLSSRMPKSEVAEFVKQGKETKTGRDAAYVLVLPPKGQDKASVAQNVMLGADGFLCEPYSVDGLMEISTLAGVVKKERVRTRQELMIATIVKDCGDQLDEIALSLYLGRPAGEPKRNFRELTATLGHLAPELLAVYYSALVDQWDLRKAPYKPEVPKSKRVQEKMKKQAEAKASTGGYRIVRG